MEEIPLNPSPKLCVSTEIMKEGLLTQRKSLINYPRTKVYSEELFGIFYRRF